MLQRFYRCFTVTLALVFTFASPGFAVKGSHSAASSEKQEKKDKSDKKGKEKPFKKLIKDRVVIEGLFTFYHDTTDNSLLMAVTPEHFGPIYLWGETRSQGDGEFYDNGTLGRSFPFYFKRIGKKIMVIEKNLRLRADSSSRMYRAVKSGISDHLYASVDIKSKPDKETKAVLIDPSALFIRDVANTGYYLGQSGKTGFSFDKKNSYYVDIKSFPENSEISVRLHFKTKRPVYGNALQNPYSFFHTYHYSLSSLPESDYMPRLADERVGYFLTLYQDYTNLDSETPYVRYIERWHLKKIDSNAALSEPVEPIVFWIENTVPDEYRDAVAEGIEFWNYAFEKAGYKNAIVAKQMPDDAEWDPADVRYSTVRWMVKPGSAYAVGPSRANPFTGQIYDADIRISADYVRFMFEFSDQWINPLLDGESFMNDPDEFMDSLEQIDLRRSNPYSCNYAAETTPDAAFALAYLQAMSGDFDGKDDLVKEYVHSRLVQVIAHEVGHTIGLRHNFAASTIHTLEEISDKEFTRKYGVNGSIMDYQTPNIAPEGYPQGDFHDTRPGPYDKWAIEYGYKETGASSPEEELAQLQEIASRSSEPFLVYATDEDAFGLSMKSIDPRVNIRDLGSDPLAFVGIRVDQTRRLWGEAIQQFEKPGERYQKILSVFSWGWRSYRFLVSVAPKYIGGIYHNRSRIGDPNSGPPFEAVPAAKQREAMALLRDHLFAPDAFTIDSDLLNKLQFENLEDFKFSAYTRPQVDYPYHQIVLTYQNLALYNLYGKFVLGRLLNNLTRVPDGADKYTMYDLFTDVRSSIWSEAIQPSNVNSFRRQLQLAHLTRIANIYLSGSGTFPGDARTLAANDLDILKQAATRAMNNRSLDGMSRAHFSEVVRQIDATHNAQRQYTY